jgi:hypothetical protein
MRVDDPRYSLMVRCRTDDELVIAGYKIMAGAWTKFATEIQIVGAVITGYG